MPGEILFFAKALWSTIQLTLAGFGLGFALLSVACLLCVGSKNFRTALLLFCKFFQTIPFLILLFWIYFGWGYLAERVGWSLSPFLSGWIALGISFLCFSGEAMLHALGSLQVGLLKSAESLGIRGWPLYRWILLPQLWRQIGGQIANLLLVLMKESALVSALGYFELTRASQVYAELRSSYFLGALIVLIIYWALALILQHTLLKRAPRYA